MKIIQGFISKASYISNDPMRVADFFELSPFAKTFTRHLCEYQHHDFTEDVLYILKSYDTNTNTVFELAVTQVREIMAVIQSVLSYANTNHPPFDRQDMIHSVEARHGSIVNFDMGMFFTSGNRVLPEYITYTSIEHPDTNAKIWLRNEALENQYSDYEIVVVPPIDNLDEFFGPYATAANMILEMKLSDVVNKAMLYREEIPESYLRINEFDYINRNNTAQRTKVKWPVLIYGETGDQIDAIKDAIVDHILKNSTHSHQEWEEIFPELFQRTEFRILPRWDLVSIPNLTPNSALYSSLVKPVEMIRKAQAYWDTFNQSYIENNAYIIPFDYKCLTLIVVNGMNNRPDARDLKELFPDYIPVSNLHADFNRMRIETREWITKIVEALKLAETAHEESATPPHIRKLKRDGKLYLAVMYKDVNYLVATKISL